MMTLLLSALDRREVGSRIAGCKSQSHEMDGVFKVQQIIEHVWYMEVRLWRIKRTKAEDVLWPQNGTLSHR